MPVTHSARGAQKKNSGECAGLRLRVLDLPFSFSFFFSKQSNPRGTSCFNAISYFITVKKIMGILEVILLMDLCRFLGAVMWASLGC